jgi:hypothetical protein
LPPGDIFSRLTEEERQQHQDLEDRVERLLDSAIAAIRDALGDDFAPLENVTRIYCGDLEPIRWLDAIPEMAAAGRAAVRKSKGQADAAFGAMISRH